MGRQLQRLPPVREQQFSHSLKIYPELTKKTFEQGQLGHGSTLLRDQYGRGILVEGNKPEMAGGHSAVAG